MTEEDFLSQLVVEKIYGVVRFRARPGVTTRRDNRECWALTVKHGGTTEYCCCGKKILSDKNHLVLLPRGCSYTWKTAGGECLSIDFAAPSSGAEIISFPVKDCLPLVNKFTQIEILRRDKPAFGEMKAVSLLYEMLLWLFANKYGKYTPAVKNKIIEPAVTYLTENFTDPEISNRTLSQTAGISEVYFRKLFTEIYHCAPMEYVQRLRLEKAVEMLNSDCNSVSLVAENTGYRSVYHFSKMFKRKFGVAPTRFRRMPG